MSLTDVLLDRCESKCELCDAAEPLDVYLVEAEDDQREGCIAICGRCREEIGGAGDLDAKHWRCLNQSMWSQVPAVQVMAWRLLNGLKTLSWAEDLLDTLYLDEETLAWAMAGVEQGTEVSQEEPTKDSNGTVLSQGDTVVLIKDLAVKGAGFTAKRGTAVRQIRLTSNPEQIEGRVNGTQIVLLTCFLKKN